MAKTPKNPEEAKAALELATGARKDARKAIDDFLKENKLTPMKDYTGKLEGKKQKAYDKLRAAWSEAKEVEAAAQTAYKALRPSKEREAKYEYPAGTDKKKFRAQMRANAKRAGVTVDEYIKDREKYDAKVAEGKPKKEKADKKADKKGKKEEKADKKADKADKKKKKAPKAESED